MLAPLAVAAALAPAAQGAADFSPCPGRPEVECARVQVPLDRSAPAGPPVALQVERWVARPSRGVLVLLAGGPGQASTRVFDVASTRWRELFPGYTLATFDPRGTGRSGVLSCPELDPRLPPGPEPAIAACARRVGAARALYGTGQTVHDLDAVRGALGAATVALVGISYGTRVALAYAATYPGRTERVVLDSVVPLDAPHPFASPTLRSIPAAARAICAGNACRGVTRNFAADITTLANRIGAGSLVGSVLDATGRPQRVRLWGPEFLSLVVRADVEHGLRAQLPAAVHAAVARRPHALLRLWHVLRTTEPPPDLDFFSPAVLAAGVCTDASFPWSAAASEAERRAALEAAARALPSGALGAFGQWATAYGPGAFCIPWPEAGSRPAPPPLPDIPALVVAGDVDMRTPVAGARALVARLPRAHLLVAPGVGHAVLFSGAGSCARNAIGTWLRGRKPRARCARRRGLLPTVPRPPRTFVGLGTGAGAEGRRMRTLVGVRRTLTEARSAFAIALAQSRWGAYPVTVPGVLGGSLAVGAGGAGASLRRYSFAPGLSVSGVLTLSGDPDRARLTGAFRVCGARAAPGVLTLDMSGRLRGVVGGRRIGAGGRLPTVPPCNA